MNATENALDVSLPSTEFEHQALMIIRPNNFNELGSAHISLSFISQSTMPFFESNNSIQDYKASLIHEMEKKETSNNASFTIIYDWKTPQKK